MRITPTTNAGYQLLHEGAQALSVVETNGIKVDVGYLKQTRKELTRRTEDMRKEMTESKVWKIWRKRFGDRASFTSGPQLGTVLFTDLGYKPEFFTASGKPSTDQWALEHTKDPFTVKYLRWKKLCNANDNFLAGIERETCDGVLHPFFNLNTVVSYRSSSEGPNFQNFPKRDPEIGKLIRRAFIPRWAFTEHDFKGVEVGTSACYNKDPKLIAYVKDASLDMHRDMAMEMFMLPLKEITKPIRQIGKNGFVFPEFYGDWYKSITVAVWDDIESGEVKTASGVPVIEHLRKKGITARGACDSEEDAVKGTFEHHIQEVEHSFWKVRFKVYDRWKQQWFRDYQKRGYVDSLTGFRYEGIFDRKQVCNWPIQGSAFHCLLWTLIQAQKEIRKSKARRLIIGQIHDSMLTDCPPDEMVEHCALVNDIVNRRLREHWDWIVVPLTVDMEMSVPGTTWYDKKDVKFKDDVFTFNDKRYTKVGKLFTAVKESTQCH